MEQKMDVAVPKIRSFRKGALALQGIVVRVAPNVIHRLVFAVVRILLILNVVEPRGQTGGCGKYT